MPACRKFTMEDIKSATALLKSFQWDTDAVIQLLVVANSFRGMLGVQEANHVSEADCNPPRDMLDSGECVKAS
jgi:hypothetical protein